MKKLSLFLIIAIAFFLNSCAVMFQGSKQSVNIRSMTEEAKIYVDGNLEGTDLVSIKLARCSNHTVMVKKEGCSSETVMISKHTQAGWIVFDFLFNWLAFLTDAPTCAWNAFDKDNIVVELECD